MINSRVFMVLQEDRDGLDESTTARGRGDRRRCQGEFLIVDLDRLYLVSRRSASLLLLIETKPPSMIIRFAFFSCLLNVFNGL